MNTEAINPSAANSAARLAAGFADPVHDAQNCFRKVMQAMARPGALQTFEPGLTDLPAPLTAMGAAVALTLLDYDTPVWLDPALAKSPDAVSFLRFHTGAPIVDVPVEAAFALVSEPERLSGLGNFPQGTPDYPDQSATLVLMNQTFGKGASLKLKGPGIKDVARFSTSPVPTTFWDQVQANNAQFPRGVDVIFTGETQIAALPRSTQLTRSEA
ncbi:phosphonate C-P lyase system protein PhnH [uncultured Roseibium sp.]|uniref:phosphonate C-P lyase system protein PhnH n=1 Tax=uncultured Roseibium sp. TaxID=1936171 RepID=UPI002592A6BD|nr:phosphonate C-P lyase system protein PhnH [uncultured Roseibium sp.]